MFIKDWKKDVLTIPNLLSFFRLALIPVYIIIYVNAKTPREFFIAAAILAVSCLTDLIDGKIARHFNQISTIGKVLDPLADKATQFALIICLALKYPFVWSMAAFFVVKESFQLIAGLVNYKRGRMLKGALYSGKICTTVLFISLIIIVMIPNLNPDIITVITTIDLIFMTVALGNYIFIYSHSNNKFQTIDQGEDTAS